MANKRGCLISFGGAYGAFTAGTLAKLDNDYDSVGGISTGGLMSPLVALKEWDRLKEGYTSVTQSDIFDLAWYKPSPIKKDGKINKLAVVKAFLQNKNTIGTSNSLRKTVKRFFTYDDFKKLKEINKSVYVSSQNLKQKPSELHTFNIKNFENSVDDYENFVDWMWLGANAPLLTSLVEKEWEDDQGYKHMGQWTDGGLTEFVMLSSMARGYKEIDIFVHKEFPIVENEIGGVKDLLHNVERSFDAMRYDIEFELLYKQAKLLAKKGKKVNMYFLPRKLSNSGMVFDKNQMLDWYEEGYESAYDHKRILRF